MCCDTHDPQQNPPPYSIAAKLKANKMVKLVCFWTYYRDDRMWLGPTSTDAAPVLSLSKNISSGRKKLDIGTKLLLKHQTYTLDKSPQRSK